MRNGPVDRFQRRTVRPHSPYAPEEAAILKGLKEQEDLAMNLRNTMLESVAAMVDFNKADELIAAARDDVAA